MYTPILADLGGIMVVPMVAEAEGTILERARAGALLDISN